MASQLSFTGFAWKNLWRRRLRTLLTLGGITMAIGAFVALVGFSRSFEHEWLRMYTSSGTDIAVVETNFLNSSLDQSLGPRIGAVPVVAQVAPMIFNLMDLTPEVNALVYGWLADSYEFDSLTLLSGHRFHDGKPEVLLGDLLAQNLTKRWAIPFRSKARPSRLRESTTEARPGGRRGHSCRSIRCSIITGMQGKVRHFTCGCARRLRVNRRTST